MEDAPESLTHRGHAAVDAHGVEPLTHGAVDLQDFKQWCDVPDMHESYVGKLTAPLSSNATSEVKRHQFVAQTLPELKAAMREFPHARDTVSAIWLPDDVII
jgi:hypothetical protein